MKNDPVYRYVAEYFTESGDEIGSVALDPDFQPALECCQLAGVGAGRLESTATLPPGSIQPVWADEAGAPTVRALRVSMEAERGDEWSVVDLDVSRYLRAAIRRGASRLVEEGKLTEGSLYRHRVVAFATRDESPGRRRTTTRATVPAEEEGLLELDLESGSDAVAIVERSFDALLGSVRPEAEDPLPVVLHDIVAKDLLELAAAADEVECGAGLLGFLARDDESGRLFLEVTALAPVRGGLSKERSFVFTDEAWASVQEICALRGEGELVVGWAHSHPNFCAKCPPQRQEKCSAAHAFFSEDDAHLHRTCFAKAWQVALLASDLPAQGRVLNLFGWGGGIIVPRAFTTIRPGAGAIVAPAAAATTDYAGATP